MKRVMSRTLWATRILLVLSVVGVVFCQAVRADVVILPNATRTTIETSETRNSTINNSRTDVVNITNPTQYVNQVRENRISDVHRVFTGRAEVAFAPNALYNDWDTGFVNGVRVTGTSNIRAALLNALTADEEAYLVSLGAFARKQQVYIDMTARTVSINAFDFSPRSTFTGSTTSSSSNTVTTSNTTNSTETNTVTTTFDEVDVVQDGFQAGAVFFVTAITTFINHVTQNVTTNTAVTTITNTSTTTVTNVTTNNFTDTSFQVVANVHDNSPVILDLGTDDRKVDTAHNEWRPHAPKFYAQYAKMFDITGDGALDVTEWMASNPNDGLLCMPENGKVENALQLFGTAGGYKDGYEKLAIVCDKDNNGWVEGAELNGLMLWIDANSNATCDDGELRPLSQYKITAINTKHANFVSSYKTADGKSHMSWDWWPAAAEIRMVAKN